jgi:hypothetical protein
MDTLRRLERLAHLINRKGTRNHNLSAQWQSELGDEWQSVQEKYLHTIGNLTLTGYNFELNDLPFSTKSTMEGGFIDSPLRLNRSVANKDRRDESLWCLSFCSP